MVRQGEHNDCGLATCYIIEAVAQNVALSHFTVEGIYQSRARFALCLLTESVPPISTALVSTVQSVIGTASTVSTYSADDYNIFHKDFVYLPYIDDAELVKKNNLTNYKKHDPKIHGNWTCL